MRYYEIAREEIDYFREEYEFLSNFYPTKLIFNGVTYYNAEAAYQAQKSLLQTMRFRFSNLSADEAKKLGQIIEMRPDWDEIKYVVMKQVVCAKFTQNPTLAQDLLDTGDKPLKEGNTWGDVYWGVDLKTGEGENHLGEILMQIRDYFRFNGIPEEISSCDSMKGPFGGMWLDERDITLSGCECIVNATNKNLLGIDGVDGAISRAAGPELRAECAALGGCNVGEVKLTSGYRLKAKYIIHTVGPKYPTENCQENLAKCYIESLNLAKKHEIHSIAFPSISTGKFSYPMKEACAIAVETVKNWLKDNCDYEMKVVFSCVEPSIHFLIYSELRNTEKA